MSEVEQAADNFLASIAFLENDACAVGEVVNDLVGNLSVKFREPSLNTFGKTGNGHERIIHLMGDARRQGSDGCHLLRLIIFSLVFFFECHIPFENQDTVAGLVRYLDWGSDHFKLAVPVAYAEYGCFLAHLVGGKRAKGRTFRAGSVGIAKECVAVFAFVLFAL